MGSDTVDSQSLGRHQAYTCTTSSDLHHYRVNIISFKGQIKYNTGPRSSKSSECGINFVLKKDIMNSMTNMLEGKELLRKGCIQGRHSL